MSGITDIGTLGRGQTLYGQVNAIDTANLWGQQFEGQEKEFIDQNPTTLAFRSARRNRCRLVRNMTGATIYASMVVALDPSSKNSRITAVASTTAQGNVAIVDEFLNSAGCRHGDMCWVQLPGSGGLTTVYTSKTSNAPSFAQGGLVVACTANGTTAAAAGGVVGQDLTGATAVLGGQIQNAIGVALTAATTSQTNLAILIDLQAIN